MVSNWAMNALVIDETDPTATPPGRARVASARRQVVDHVGDLLTAGRWDAWLHLRGVLE